MFTNRMPVFMAKVRKSPDLVTGLGVSKLNQSISSIYVSICKLQYGFNKELTLKKTTCEKKIKIKRHLSTLISLSGR